jgi:hypothetical protein
MKKRDEEVKKKQNKGLEGKSDSCSRKRGFKMSAAHPFDYIS